MTTATATATVDRRPTTTDRLAAWSVEPQLWRPLLIAAVVLRAALVVAPFDILDPVDPWDLGQRLLHGDVPYRDFALEYPPAALLAFVLPGLVPHGLAHSVLALQMFAVEATLLLLWRGDRGVLQRYFLLTLPLVPFLSGGFDALPMVAVAWSALLLAEGRVRAGWCWAGFGAAVKVLPGAMWGTSRRWGVTGVAALAVALVTLVAPLAVAGGVDTPVGYHSDRGVQNESVASSMVFVANQLRGVDTEYHYRFRSNEVDGAGLVSTATLVGFGLAALALAALAWRRDAPRMVPVVALALLCLLLCGSRVLSPQFVTLGAPLAAAIGGRTFVRFLPVAYCTWLPFLVADRRSDGFVALATTRNLALVTFTVFVVRDAVRGLSGGSSPPVSLEPGPTR